MPHASKHELHSLLPSLTTLTTTTATKNVQVDCNRDVEVHIAHAELKAIEIVAIHMIAPRSAKDLYK
jgi:hypothetical protein